MHQAACLAALLKYTKKGYKYRQSKIGKKDQIDEELMSFINERTNENRKSRRYLAQIAANNVGKKRLLELFEVLWR